MIEIDARGLRCPWPALRLARAMRDADAVRIVADDPAAARELAALAHEHRWAIAQDGIRFEVVRAVTDASPGSATSNGGGGPARERRGDGGDGRDGGHR